MSLPRAAHPKQESAAGRREHDGSPFSGAWKMRLTALNAGDVPVSGFARNFTEPRPAQESRALSGRIAVVQGNQANSSDVPFAALYASSSDVRTASPPMER